MLTRQLHFGAQLGVGDEADRLDRAGSAFQLAAQHSPTPEIRQANVQRLEAVRRRMIELREAVISNAPPASSLGDTDAPEPTALSSSPTTSAPTSQSGATPPLHASQRGVDAHIVALLRDQVQALGRISASLDRAEQGALCGPTERADQSAAERREAAAIQREADRERAAERRHRELLAATAAPHRPPLSPTTPTPIGSVAAMLTAGSPEERDRALSELGCVVRIVDAR